MPRLSPSEVDFSSELRKIAEVSDDFDKLIPLLRSISIDTIKQTIIQHVGEIDTAILKVLYRNSASINEIIPDQVIQYILTFNIPEIHTTKLVNKQWYKLSQQYEKNQYLKLQQSLDQNSPIKYNKNENQTWILHPQRKQLTEIEKSMGFKGPINPCYWDQSLSSETFEPLKSGDRLFIHNGYYKLDDIKLATNISMIGMGDVHICSSKGPLNIGRWNYHESELKCAHAYAENIRFQNLLIRVLAGSTLSLNKCEFMRAGAGISAKNNSSLNVKNCMFNDTKTAIKISPIAKNININKNIFKTESEEACIEIFFHYIYSPQASGMFNGKPSVKLICVGNVFENNSCYPIAEKAQMLFNIDTEQFCRCENPLYIDKCELYELRDNVVKIDNSNAWRKCENYDANKMYFINK